MKMPLNAASAVDRVDFLLSQISGLNSSEKSRFLRKLVKKSSKNTSEMQFLRSLVGAVPVISGLDLLPSEVISKVLGNLDVKSLGRLAGSSRKWATSLLTDYRPWKALFEQELSGSRISAAGKAFFAQISPLIGPFAYSSTLFYESRLQRNWTMANPGISPLGFACHGSHVVTCMEIDPAGRFILTGSDDGTVKLWNAANGEECRSFSGHLGGVWALRVDWQRNLLITGSTDRTLILWNLQSGERLKHFLGHTSTVRCVELSGDRIVSGSRDGTLRVWDVESGECLHVLQGHSASVRCLSLTPSGWGVVSGSYDFTCRLWDLRSGQCLQTFTGHSNKVYVVACTDKWVFSGSLDGSVRCWDPQGGACCQVISGHRSLVGLVQSRPELLRDLVVSGSTDGSLQILRDRSVDPGAMESGGLIESALLPTAHPSSITSLDFNRNFLVTGSEGVVRLWALPAAGSKSPEPKLIANLVEIVDMVWRVGLSDNLAVVAYQLQGQTRLAIFNFAPTSQQALLEMRSFNKIPSNTSATTIPSAQGKSGKQAHSQQQPPLLLQPQHAQIRHPVMIDDNYTANQPQLHYSNYCRFTTDSGSTVTAALQLHPELLALGAASSSLVASYENIPSNILYGNNHADQNFITDDIIIYSE